MKNLKSGDKISYLELIEKKKIDGKEQRRKYWVCKCICGKIVTRRSDYLTQGRTMSCGCKHPLKEMTETKSPIWNGCGRLSKQHFSMIEFLAKKRGIEFNITIEEAWNIYTKQKGLCKLTSLPIDFSGQRQRKKGIEQTASLDRIDSNKGYTIDNIQWVHKDVNRMKNAFSTERFLEICKLVTENSTQDGQLP